MRLSLWLALVLALVGGALLNLMPCVFPVLSLKVLGFAAHGGDRDHDCPMLEPPRDPVLVSLGLRVEYDVDLNGSGRLVTGSTRRSSTFVRTVRNVPSGNASTCCPFASR